MTIAEILEKMISFSNGNIHDIDHLIRVWTFAKTIGELEHIDAETQYILEVAAITHDIACPSAGRNTEMLTANIRNSKAGPWCGNFCMTLALLRRR